MLIFSMMLVNTTGQFMLCQFHKDGVLADALDFVPRDNQIILFAKAEDSTTAVDNQG